MSRPGILKDTTPTRRHATHIDECYKANNITAFSPLSILYVQCYTRRLYKSDLLHSPVSAHTLFRIHTHL